ncbi:MAG TPA: glycosyltransferase [Gaiellales bacterium]|jgi:glycosyltransferase involved in cell wall biosynthesis
MRIAMISEHASPLAALGGVDAGGQNVHVASLAAALGRRGVPVVVYTRRDDPSLAKRVRLAPGVVVEHVPAGPACEVPKDELWPYMREFAAHVQRSLERDRPELVHAHFWMSGAAAVWATDGLDLPVVQTFHALGVVKRRHQGAADTSPRERLAVERDLLQRVNRVVATCSDEVFELARMDADLRRVDVVPCGVDLNQFNARGPAEPRPSGRPRLVVLSRMVTRKGIGNTIEALAELPGVELVVAGGPPKERLHEDEEGRRLMRLAETCGVADRVDFRGRIERADAPALLRSADAVVCVPWYEPFGIVPLEAMACGVPVIASSVGGLVDTVVHGVTGLHVPPRRPDRVADAARQLLADPALRRRLGVAGAARARRRYGWDVVADGTLRSYAQVLSPATARRRARVAAGGDR